MRLLFLFALILLPSHALALDNFTVNVGGEQSFTGNLMQMIALISILSIAPGILIMVTSFTRIIVVLSMLRSAIGLQQTPPNSVLISLALFLTAFVMQPTFTESYNTAIKPLMEEKIGEAEAFDKGMAPFKTFMLKHTREKDLKLFVDLANVPKIEKAEDTPLRVVIPAFMISELKRAFEIGFLIFIPFLIIDMLVSSVLMAMGMMMLPPVVVSLPFKLVFFVLVDGWFLIAGSLVQSYG
jgi:flagellar biosynthetic protein FliP